jgi:hypothetical protein
MQLHSRQTYHLPIDLDFLVYDQLPSLPDAASETSPEDQNVQPPFYLSVKQSSDRRPAVLLLSRLGPLRFNSSTLS